MSYDIVIEMRFTHGTPNILIPFVLNDLNG